MTARKKKYLPLIAGFIVILLLIILFATKLGKKERPVQAEATDTSAAITYLQQLEAKDPGEIDQIRKDQRAEELLRMREERLRQLESGEISVWSLFEDYVLLGDSRAVGFYFYEFLPQTRVLAEAGSTIRKLQEHIPDIVALNPSSIFVCYGLNDISIGLWQTPEDYVAEFSDTLGQIQDELPEARIFVSSILPARDPAFQKSTAWYDIPEYSAAVKDMCDSMENCYYVDNDQLAVDYADLWEVDGIHFTRDFYPHWAANLILEEYSVGLSIDEAE